MSCERVVIMAGGTGGHVFPALALAEVLRERGKRVSWLGTRKGIEAELVPANDFPIDYIQIEGVRGTGILRLIKAPFLLLLAVMQSFRALRKVRPDVVVGLGGFASGPGGLAAWLLRKPLVIHEQNAVAGTTNKVLAKLAKRVMVAFPGALKGGIWCGNPVRREISALPTPDQRMSLQDRKPRLLVLGGSLGAAAINDLIPGVLARFPEQTRPDVWHQTGKRNFEVAQAAYRARGISMAISGEDGVRVAPFIDDMAAAYGWADYAVCRAGALTVSELAAAGLGALLVPYPHAIDDHQTINGEWLVAAGAATLIQQSDLREDVLFEHLNAVFADSPALIERATKARAVGKTDAAEVLANICDEVAHV